MTKQEKKEGKVLLSLLNDYHKHYAELPKEKRIKENKYQEWHKHYCAGAKYGLQLAIELVEVFLKGRLQKVLERMEYYGEEEEKTKKTK